MRKLALTKTRESYDAAVVELRNENDGKLPDWWHAAVELSGFAKTKEHQWRL